MSVVAALTAAAAAAGISANTLLALCWVESTHRPEAINHKDGASPSLGLCQVKLTTAQMFDQTVTEGALLRPEINARFAALYYKKQLQRYSGSREQALAAYNAGTVRFDNAGTLLNNGYVTKVLKARKEKPWKKTKLLKQCSLPAKQCMKSMTLRPRYSFTTPAR